MTEIRINRKKSIYYRLSIIVLWVLSVRWIYFKKGAEFIETHPGLIKKSFLTGNTNVTAMQIKIFYPLMLLCGIGGLIMMWNMDVPMP